MHLIIHPEKVRRTRAYQSPKNSQLRCLFGQYSHTGGESRLSILRASVVVPLLYIARYRGRGGGGAGGGQYAPLTFPLPFHVAPCTRNGYVSFLCLRAGCELVCVCVCEGKGRRQRRGRGGEPFWRLCKQRIALAREGEREGPEKEKNNQRR